MAPPRPPFKVSPLVGFTSKAQMPKNFKTTRPKMPNAQFGSKIPRIQEIQQLHTPRPYKRINPSTASSLLNEAKSAMMSDTFEAPNPTPEEDQQLQNKSSHAPGLHDMTDLAILKDKAFYDYLLQSLYDHDSQLNDYENVTVRLEFTEEFFASYWLQLMKILHVDYVPPVTVKEYEHHKKINNGFDSIHRSVFEICESRVNLRVTTKFVINGKELADEEQTKERNLFMLVLLFVSEWIAYQNENCPQLILKESMAPDVYTCFNKLFKDIYQGKDENLKALIFEQNKENLPVSKPFHTSPNRSFGNFNISDLNITPYFNPPVNDEVEHDALLDRLSKANEALMEDINAKAKNEEKLQADLEQLQETLNSAVLEMEEINKANGYLIKENENLQRNLENFEYQKEQEKQHILKENQSLNILINKLQNELDSRTEKVTSIQLEADHLKKEYDGLTKVVNTYKDNEEKLKEEKETLEQTLVDKMLELDAINKLNADSVEEKRHLHQEIMKAKRDFEDSNNLIIQKETEINNILNDKQSLNGTISKLQMDHDLCVDQLSNALAENDRLNEEVDELTKVVNRKSRSEEKLQADLKQLQETLNSTVLEMEEINKANGDLIKENENLQRNFTQTKQNLENLEYQKEQEKQHILKENQSLNILINKLQNELDSRTEEVTGIQLEADNLKKEYDGLTKVVNTYKDTEERLKEEKEALQQTINDKMLELDNINRLYADVVEEKRHLHDDFMKTKQQLEDSDKIITEKEETNKKVREENQCLKDCNDKMKSERDSCNEELAAIKLDADRLQKENVELIDVINSHAKNEEIMKEEKEALEQALVDKMLELDAINKLNADAVEEKRHLHQEIMKAKRDFEDSNNLIIQKETEINNILNDKQSLNGIISKLQMDHDLCVDQLSDALAENDRLKEEVDELTKVVNRKSRNEEKLEEDKQYWRQQSEEKASELERTKALLSKVQAELRLVVNQLRDLQLMKSELQAEFDAFKDYFDNAVGALGDNWSSIKMLMNDLANERLHNVSLSNELEKMREQMNASDRSRTPSLHDEGIMGYDSRRTSFNGPNPFDLGNMSQLMSEPFDEQDERHLDSGIGSNEHSPETSPRDAAVSIQQPSFLRRCVSSISTNVMLLFSFIFLFIMYMYSFGALIPSWIYIKVHHDHLPPQ